MGCRFAAIFETGRYRESRPDWRDCLRLLLGLALLVAVNARAQISEERKYQILQRDEIDRAVRPLERAGQIDKAVDILISRSNGYRSERGGDFPLVVETAQRAAGLEAARGHVSAALRIYENLFAGFAGLPAERQLRAEALPGLARVYETAGSLRRAQELRREAMAQSEKIARDRRVLGEAFSTALDLGETEEARRYLDRDTEASAESRDPLEREVRLKREIRLLRAEGRISEANALLDRAKDLPAVFGREFLSPEQLIEAGEIDRAEKLVVATLRFYSGSPGRTLTKARYLHLYARCAALKGNRPGAILFGKLAIDLLQAASLSFDMRDGELRREFLGRGGQPFRDLAEWLIDEGRLAESQAVLAMLKIEEVEAGARIRRAGTREKVEFTPQEAALVGGVEEATLRTARIGAEIESLRSRSRDGLSAEEERRLENLREGLRTANESFRAALDGLLGAVASESGLRNQQVGERNLRSLKALQGALREIGPGAVAVHYLRVGERLHAIVTTPSVQLVKSFTLPESQLNRAVFALRQSLLTPSGAPQSHAQRLHELVFSPIAADLADAHARHVLLSLDGVLRYVPFAALHDGRDYLVRRFAFSLLTEGSRDTLRDKPGAKWTVGAFGTTRPIDGHVALPTVQFELEAVAGGERWGVLPGDIRLDRQFDLPALQRAIDRPHAVLHIASHFAFLPGAEDESYLLLGDGNRLTLRDIKERDIDFTGVDLLTLSACETAIGGGRDATGREVEGLGTLAQRQGAKAVIATLWQVADESTGRFMATFYAAKVRRDLSKSEAIRQTQLAMLDRKDDFAAPGNDYSHPFHWAPFVLMGNWR